MVILLGPYTRLPWTGSLLQTLESFSKTRWCLKINIEHFSSLLWTSPRTWNNYPPFPRRLVWTVTRYKAKFINMKSHLDDSIFQVLNITKRSPGLLILKFYKERVRVGDTVCSRLPLPTKFINIKSHLDDSIFQVLNITKRSPGLLILKFYKERVRVGDTVCSRLPLVPLSRDRILQGESEVTPCAVASFSLRYLRTELIDLESCQDVIAASVSLPVIYTNLSFCH
ncbi:hypothetical protein J6590_089329 [Homalodisca vitripennis]|nr:hypothetical protein J6590_089329 [Homalodisca vitripennis]